MNSREEILQTLQTILVEMFELDKMSVVPEARLYEDLDIDSIDAIDIVVKVREITGIKLKPELFKTVRTVEDVVEAVYTLASR